MVALYAYDALNRRVERQVGGDTYETVWDGWQAIEEYENNDLVRRQIYGPGIEEIVSLEIKRAGDPALVRYTPLYDSVGNLKMLLDDAGEPVEHYDYSP